MSSNPQQIQNNNNSAQEQGSTNLTNTVASSSSIINAPNNQENNENELNSSIGSNRSLNNSSRLFRINRDFILNSVFQEIRPLVTTTTSSNAPFASWMRSSLQSVHASTNNEEHSAVENTNNNRQDNNDSSSVIINIGSPPSTSYGRQNSAPARSSDVNNDEMGSDSINQSRTSLHQNNLNSDSSSNINNSNNNNNTNNSSSTNNVNTNSDDPNAVDGNSDNLAQIPEARALINTVSRYFPYFCILFAKTCYDHLDGLLDIFALFIVFAHSNFTLKQEITKQAQRRFLYLIRELLYIVLVVTIIFFLLEKKEKSISLFFAPLSIQPEGNRLALKDLLFSVIITDLILKLITVAVKILFTMLPSRCVEFKNRGRVYLLIEAFSQLYRALVPIQLWLTFLLESYKGTEKIMGVIFSAAYIVSKGSDLLHHIKFLKRSFIKFLQKTSFGTTPTKEQIQAAGGTCPICHDSYTDPVILNECNHIFCELCLLGWLDRSNSTCPLCRAKIDQDNPGYRDGSTTFFIQFY